MSAPPASPYPGLRPFTSEEADRFFGRGQQVEELLAKLEERRFMAVVGVSGCGKSSLVRAGLVPAIEQGFLSSDARHWRIAQMRPSGDPYGRLGAALLTAQALGPERGDDARAAALLDAILRRGSLGLAQAVAASGLPPGTNLLLLVDQFEELFRFRTESAGTAGANDADAFVRLLLDSAPPPRPGAAPTDAGAQVYVVLTMRSDFLGDCALFTGLPEAINDSQFLTPRLTREQYREAIEGPARLCGGALDPALVAALLNDMRADPDQIPVLQHALMRMWTRAAERPDWDHRLTLADYQAPEIGGLKAALSNHCDQVLAGLEAPQQALAQVLFRALSERGGGRRDTRRPTTLGRIGDLAGVDPAAIEPVVEAFRHPDRSFLTPPPPEALKPGTVLDISHESLIAHWETLERWVRAEADSADLYRRLLDAARRRADPTGGGAALWRAEDLKAAVAWRDQEQPNAIWAERYGGGFALAVAFLDDSRAEEEQEATLKRRQQLELEAARVRAGSARMLRRWLSIALALLMIAMAAAGFGYIQWQHAQTQAINAEKARGDALNEAKVANDWRSKYLSAEADRLQEQQSSLSLLLGIEALHRSADPSVQSALIKVLGATQSLPLAHHAGAVRALAFDPRGARLASAGTDGAVRILGVQCPRVRAAGTARP